MKTIIFLLLLTIIISCDSKTQYSYYPSGEISEKREYFNKNDTASYLLTEYYQNKQIKIQGTVINSMRDGFWHEWYADGDKLWTGEYYKNILLHPYTIIGSPKYLFFDSLIVGKRTFLRIIAEGVHRKNLSVAWSAEYEVHIAREHLDLYDYVIFPYKEGYVTFYVWSLDENEPKLTEFRDSFYVYPRENGLLNNK
jgi:hypothetical protein